LPGGLSRPRPRVVAHATMDTVATGMFAEPWRARFAPAGHISSSGDCALKHPGVRCALPGRVLARFARGIVRMTAGFRAIAITHLSLDLCSAPSGRFASLRPRVASRRRFRKSSTVWTEAFLYERTIDSERYDRPRDKLREELTLVQMDRRRHRARRTQRGGHPGVC
jgi:hypothetical protein